MKERVGVDGAVYRIGSINCKNFGRGASKNIKKFVDIISSEEFDIIALQEIKGQAALDRILTGLSPDKWKGIADEDPTVNDYAFIWNATKFELAKTEELGYKRTYAPRIYKQYRIDRKNGQKELIREPFFARFFPVGPNAPFIEIRLINTHIRFSKGKDASENSPGTIAMRRNEYDVLTKAIYAKEADKRYGNNRPAYTILLGDYNLNLPSSMASSPYLVEAFTIEDGRERKNIRTIQNKLSTLASNTDTKDPIKGIFANNYDHFTYDEERFDDVTVRSYRVNAVRKYCSGNQEKYLKEISDHMPITVNLEFRG